MAFNDKEDVPQHIYQHWHAMITAQDLPGLLKLRADDAVLESSAARHREKVSWLSVRR